MKIELLYFDTLSNTIFQLNTFFRDLKTDFTYFMYKELNS